MASEFGELNSVGEVREHVRSEYGGNAGRGPIDNVYPTGIVANGNEVTARTGSDRGERKEMSIERNKSKARGMGSRK